MKLSLQHGLAGLMLFGLGVVCGHAEWFSAAPAAAAPDELGAFELSRDSLYAFKRMRSSMTDLADTLQAEGAYRPGATDVNYFAASVGGLDVVKDLEEGRGVDPETFAALYADRASAEISQYLDRDQDRRITYKGKVVRMYSEARLKELFRRRDELGDRSRNVTE